MEEKRETLLTNERFQIHTPLMNACFLRETSRTACHLALYPLLVLGFLLFLCKSTCAVEPATFAPLPKQSSFTWTNGIILVSPTKLNFGSLEPGKSATNTFLVENFGRGKLVGAAAVSGPFKIISGGSYSLKEKEIQVITVVYAPEHVGAD